MSKSFNLITFFTLLFVATISTAQMENTKLSWLTNLDEAQTISQTDNKPILIYFTGSDWCAPCMRLKEDFFENPKFTQQANNLVLVKIDYPRRVDIISEEQLDYNKTIIAKYNKQQTFPKIVMLNSEGKEIGRISGYSPSRDTKNHFEFLKTHLEK